MRALDGLRGIAVLAVLAYHADLGWARGGFLGVDVFFVLSGYLITSLLLAERRRAGSVSLVGFWGRRARRLMPALGLLFLAVIAYAALRPDQPSLTTLRGDVLAGLGYVANWRFVAQGQGYFTAFAPSALRHLWSLAIEEQFYLVWPFAFLVVMRARRPFAVVLALAAASAVWMFVATNPADPSRAYYGTDTHAHGLLLGAALAWVPIPRTRWLGVAGALAALAALVCMGRFDGTDPFVYRGGLVAFELLVVVVVAACVQPRSSLLGRALSWRPIVTVGLVSYGLYLWHWPVFVLLDEQLVGVSGWRLRVVQLVVTAAVTAFSYVVIEMPIRRGALDGRRPLVAVPLLAGGLVASLLLVSASLESPVAAATRAAKRQATLARDVSAGRRVLLVGDSSAWSLAPGLPAAGPPGAPAFVDAAVPGCALDWNIDARTAAGVWTDFPKQDDCAWPRVWPSLLGRYEPDVVLLNFGLWDRGDHRIGDTVYRYGSPQWDRHMGRRIDEAVRVAGSSGAVVGIVLSPSFLTPPSIEAFDELLLRFARARGVPVLDLRPVVDPHGTDYRWDGVHYTAEGADAVGAALTEWVGRSGPHPR